MKKYEVIFINSRNDGYIVLASGLSRKEALRYIDECVEEDARRYEFYDGERYIAREQK